MLYHYYYALQALNQFTIVVCGTETITLTLKGYGQPLNRGTVV